jgi:hypothetical protein
MAKARFQADIYIIITSKMKTTDNTIKTGNSSWTRSFLVVVGVATAIIGSIVFVHDFHGNAHVELRVPSAMTASKIVNAERSIQATSTLWSLK